MSFREALLVEREGYLRLGRDDRVAEVDAELAKLPSDDATVLEAAAVDKSEAVESAVTRPTRRR